MGFDWEVAQSDRNALYPYLGGGYMSMYCPNSLNFTFKVGCILLSVNDTSVQICPPAEDQEHICS